MSRAFLPNICLAVLAVGAIVALSVSLRSPFQDEPRVASAAAQPSGDTKSQRLEMVKRQIAARGVKDKNVLAAMRKVRRHDYVPKDLRREAYSDWPLPIGYGQTISQPYIVAMMTELLKPKKTDRILEIGTGSGYQAAVLAEIVDEVWTIEIIKELGEKAKKILEEKYPKKVKAKVADGYYGWKEGAPFDGIIVTCAANNIPAPLVKQLKEAGRMVVPVGSLFYVQNLIVVEKKKGGDVITRNICPVAFVPMTGAIQKQPPE
jgi:protein-L-isoaspartate(D-aspartate) O-methyltransferase